MRRTTILCLGLVLLAAGLAGCYHVGPGGAGPEDNGTGGTGGGYATADDDPLPAPPHPAPNGFQGG